MGMKICCIGFVACASCVFLVLGILVVEYFDPLVATFFDKELVNKNGSETLIKNGSETLIKNGSETLIKNGSETYANVPLKVYFFNVTNADEYLADGVKPILKEIGPYAYREHLEIFNMSLDENRTVSYQTLKYYYFDRSMSSGPEEDLVHTLDVPVAVAVDRVKYANKFVKLALSSMFQLVNKTAFVTKTVNELLWGYDDPLLDLDNRFLPEDQMIPFKEFGFFYQKNGSTDGVTSHPPSVTKNSTLCLFNENLCRSLPLTYSEDVERYGIKGYRFTPPPDVFADVSKKKENECYCVGGPPCIGGGVFNISVCKYDSPYILSWPHFFQADKKYLNAVEGLEPDEGKHQLYIDIEPRTGILLAAQDRIQISIATLRVPEIKAVANMTNMIFPVIWFEEDAGAEFPLELITLELIALLQIISVIPEVIATVLVSLGFELVKLMKWPLAIMCFIVGGRLLVASLECFHMQFKRRANLEISSKNKRHTILPMSSEHQD